MLDEKDRAIVSILQYDGRTPYTKISSELGIAEGSVRQRVKRLNDSGVLKIVGIAEAGIIGITVQADLITEVAEAITHLPEVSYLVQAAGNLICSPRYFAETKNISFLS